jgi:asparagine N-glycosylation enzyme membrane subunit Stt3
MYYVLAIAAIGGFVVMLRRRAALWPLAAAVLTVVVSSILTYGTQRFRITAEPAIVVFAAVGLVALGRVAAGRGGRYGPVAGPTASPDAPVRAP